MLIVLSMVMVLTFAPTTAFAYFHVSTVNTADVNEITPIVLDRQYDLYIDGAAEGISETKWFEFTPSEEDTYVFYSEGDYNTYVVLYELQDGNYTSLAYDDDINYSNRNFALSSTLSAGKTYYYCVSMYDSSKGSFKVRLEKNKVFSSMSINGKSQPGIANKDLYVYPTAEIDIKYTDGTVSAVPVEIRISSTVSNEKVYHTVGSYTDIYNNYYYIKMQGKDINDYYNCVPRTYTAKVVLGSDVEKQCDFSFEYKTFEDYFKNAPKMEVGSVFSVNSEYTYIDTYTPYIFENEADSRYCIENITSRDNSKYARLLFIKDKGDGTYSSDYCSTDSGVGIGEGKYYVILASGAKDTKFLFGYENNSVYVPLKGISAPSTLTMNEKTCKIFEAKLIPETASADLTYTSSNPKVATIDAYGIITAVAPGTTTITVVAGTTVKKCVVTVKKVETVTPTKPAVVKPGKVTKLVVKNSKKNTVSVKFNKAKNAKKYVIRYSTDKNFKKGVKTKTITKNSCLIKKLKKGKTYYFKVRAINGTAKGSYTRAKRVKIKK